MVNGPQNPSKILLDVQDHERRILAGRLHDEVGQALAAVMMHLDIVIRTIEGDTVNAVPLEEARLIGENALHSVRDISHRLHPAMVEDLGLAESLMAYVRSFSRQTGIQAVFGGDGGAAHRLMPGEQLSVYRIVQEALTNVARHSGARHTTISFVADDDAVRFCVEDDGRGIDASALEGPTLGSRAGYGLLMMRERAQALGGTFTIENRQETGTRVSVRLPLSTSVTSAAENGQLLAS